MKRALRRKIIIQQIANKLEKYDRRIQKMAENAYKLRQFLQTLLQQKNEESDQTENQEQSQSSGSAVASEKS